MHFWRRPTPTPPNWDAGKTRTVEHCWGPRGQQIACNPPGLWRLVTRCDAMCSHLWRSERSSCLTECGGGALLRPCHEAHVPAAQYPPGSHAWLPRSYVDAGGPKSAAESPPQRQKAPGADDLQEVVAFDFGRPRRLRKHKEFARAQRSGRRVATPHFTLLVAAQQRRTGPRLGVVVARAVGTAAQRNRVKRLCRECFRLWPELLPAGVDLVVIARPGADRLALSDVQTEWRAVESLLKRRAAEALARADEVGHPGAGRS
jgi:ribonuclease P protein component